MGRRWCFLLSKNGLVRKGVDLHVGSKIENKSVLLSPAAFASAADDYR